MRPSPSAPRLESTDTRRRRARTLAAFFAAGAVLSTSVLLGPGWPQMDRAGIAVTVVMAAIGAALLTGLAEHVGRASCHAAMVVGTALIGACQVLAGGGSASASYGVLYVWVTLHAALFFPRAVIAAHLGVCAVAHAAAMIWLGDIAVLPAQLALTVGTQIAAALVVGSLSEQQRRLAETDALTGLGNRRHLEQRLAATLAQGRRRPGPPVCLAVLDLDGFKPFNDREGHLAGDLLLADAAATWTSLLRRGDTLARTGGDEFTVVLVDRDVDTAGEVVRRLLTSTPSAVTCSAGLARWDGEESAMELMERADRAMYVAKSSGPLVIAPMPDTAAATADAAPGVADGSAGG